MCPTVTEKGNTLQTTWIKTIFAFSLCLILIGCSNGSGTSAASSVQTPLVSNAKENKAGVPTIDEAVKACQDAYHAFFGPQGCIPNKMKETEITAACQAYSEWSAKGYACGDAAYVTFFQCLTAIECSIFDYEEDETALKESFLDCRAQFVKDMNLCWADKQYP